MEVKPVVVDLTISEFARITRRNIETVRRLARMGRIPGAYKLGGRWMISREASDRIRRLSEACDRHVR